MSPHACCNCSAVLLAVVLLVAVQLQTPVAVTGGAGAVLWLVAHHLHGPAVAFCAPSLPRTNAKRKVRYGAAF